MKPIKTFSNRVFTGAAVVALSLSVSAVADAGNSQPDPNAYAIGYELVDNECNVFVTSDDKAISNITIDDGTRIHPTTKAEGYKIVIGTHMQLSEKTIYIKSGDNALKGKNSKFGNNGTGAMTKMVVGDIPTECMPAPTCDLGDRDAIVSAMYIQLYPTDPRWTFISCEAIPSNEQPVPIYAITATYFDLTQEFTNFESRETGRRLLTYQSTTPQQCFDFLCSIEGN